MSLPKMLAVLNLRHQKDENKWIYAWCGAFIGGRTLYLDGRRFGAQIAQ